MSGRHRDCYETLRWMQLITLEDRISLYPVLSKLVFCGGSSHPSATTLHGSANPHFVIPRAQPRDLLCALTSNKGPIVSSQLLTKRFDRPKQLTRRAVAK